MTPIFAVDDLTTAVGLAGIASIIGAIIVRIESLAKVWCDIKLALSKNRREDENETIGELRRHMEKCDEQLDVISARMIANSEEKKDILIELEALFGYVYLLHHVSVKNATQLRILGGTPDEPPPPPIRKIRRPIDSDFEMRTSETTTALQQAANDTIKKATDTITGAPVKEPTHESSSGRGQS